jgi:hypothetical protein
MPALPGVTLAAFHELEFRDRAFENGTVQPSTASGAVTTTLAADRGPSPNPHGSIPVLAYVLRLSPTLVMNGVSSFYYRSPLAWDANFTRHIVDIRDPAGRIVAARSLDTSAAEPAPDTTGIAETAVVGGRIYYRIFADLASDVNYTVEEYVETRGDLGVPSVDVWTAEGQDIDGSGAIGYRVFPGTPQEVDIGEGDASYLFRFLYGTGVGGNVNLAAARPGDTTLHLEDHDVFTRTEAPVSDSVNELRVVIPLKTTRPLNGSVLIRDNATGATCAQSFADASGTLILLCPISNPALWPAHVGPAQVDVVLEVDNFASADTGPGCTPAIVQTYGSCTLLSWPEEPRDPSSQQTGLYVLGITSAAGTRNEIHETEPWIEIYELEVPNPSSESDGSSMRADLVGADFLLAGILLLGVATIVPTLGLSLAIVGAAAATGLAGATFLTGATAGIDGRLELAAAWPQIEGTVGAIALISALLPCGGALIAPGLVAKLALGAACALVLGGGSQLLAFALDIPEVIKQGVEVLGQLLSAVAQVIVPTAITFLTLAAFMLGVFAVGYAVLVPVKFALLFLLGAVATLVHDGDPRTWGPFVAVRTRLYLPGWSELMEQRFGLFEPPRAARPRRVASRRRSASRGGSA